MARIVFFSYDRAIDRRAILQCNTLLAHGHEVILYALAHADMAADPAYVRRIGTVAAGDAPLPLALRLRHHLQAKFPRLFRATLPLLRFAYWQMRRDPAALYVGLYRQTLEKVGAADLYVAHDLPMLPVALEAKRRYGGRVLYDSHELFADQEFTAIERRMWRRFEASMIQQADAVVTVNPAIAALLQTRYGLPEVGVVLNAEWVSDTPPVKGCIFHEQLGLPQSAKLALYQGMLSYHRNLEGLVEAMRYVQDPDIHLVFLGSGPARDGLRARAQQLGVATRVHGLAAVPQAQLLAYTASADVGVIPYRDICLNYRYCTPNKLFEFVAAGLPVLASDLPEIARIVGEYGLGMVGDMNDARTAARLMETALAPETLAVTRARVMAARATLNWQHEGERFAQIVASVLSR